MAEAESKASKSDAKDAGSPSITEKWIELLKAPVWVFSILGAAIIAHSALGLKLGAVSKVTAGGVEFQNEAGNQIADLTSRVDAATAAIKQLQQRNISRAQFDPNDVTQTQVDDAGLAAPDRVAKLASVAASASAATPVRGYIWLGNFDGARWTRATANWLDSGRPIDKAPGLIAAGTELSLNSNVYIRDGLPANDVNDFNGHKTLGVAPSGSRVRIVSAPVLIDRTSAKQCWVQVDIL